MSAGLCYLRNSMPLLVQNMRTIQYCLWFSVLRLLCSQLYTSSTAQGGGGSFKNRKPIGEVGSCESGMAKRSHWCTERWLISLTISLSFSDYPPTYLPTYLSIYLSLSVSVCLSVYLSLHLSIYCSCSCSCCGWCCCCYCCCCCCCCCCRRRG